MEITTRTSILRLTDTDSRLEVYISVNGVELANPNTICAGPTQDVQEFSDGTISWPELAERWKPKG